VVNLPQLTIFGRGLTVLTEINLLQIIMEYQLDFKGIDEEEILSEISLQENKKNQLSTKFVHHLSNHFSSALITQKISSFETRLEKSNFIDYIFIFFSNFLH
jgi:hypothetical protein